MELQFNQSVIPCLRTLARQVQTQEQTQEVRLSDGMPDIGRVLASWGQVLLRGKEWRSGGAGANGGVMVWVLYAPEDASEVRCVESWLPFQVKWDFADTGRDGTLMAQPLLYSVDARSLSARKLMVRATVGVLGQAMVQGDAEPHTPGDLPEDVCILKNTYPVLLPVEAGEKLFNLEESLTLPADAPQIGKLLRYTLQPKLTESKIVADKLVMRGVALLGVLYRSVDGQICQHAWELPFSQYAQLDKDYDPGADAQITLAVTALELESGEEENLALKAGITAQYVICQKQMIEVAEDAYSPRRTVRPEITQLQLPAILQEKTQTVKQEHSVETPIVQLLDVMCYPEHPQLHRAGDSVSADLFGQYQLLGYDADGQLQSTVSRWQDMWDFDCPDDVSVEMTLMEELTPQLAVGDRQADLQMEIPLRMQTIADQGIPMVTGLELGELQQPDPNRPSLILRRAGADSLWDIAKSTGSTVESIQKANALSQEPFDDQVLLIPIL